MPYKNLSLLILLSILAVVTEMGRYGGPVTGETLKRAENVLDEGIKYYDKIERQKNEDL